jgi:hypothetical protein
VPVVQPLEQLPEELKAFPDRFWIGISDLVSMKYGIPDLAVELLGSFPEISIRDLKSPGFIKQRRQLVIDGIGGASC